MRTARQRNEFSRRVAGRMTKIRHDLHLLAFSCNIASMPRSRTTNRTTPAPRRRASSAPPAPSGKVAITIRLDPARVQQLQAAAGAENRTLTNFVETALIRDLALRDEASRVVAMHAAPGTSTRIDPADILRAEGETDLAYANRQSLLTELWSIPDSD